MPHPNPALRPRYRRAPDYRVLVSGHDIPQEFLSELLQQVFGVEEDLANGLAMMPRPASMTCGVYSREIAETKAMCVQQIASDMGIPLDCRIEPVGN